jgi:hypothetical protein
VTWVSTPAALQTSAGEDVFKIHCVQKSQLKVSLHFNRNTEIQDCVSPLCCELFVLSHLHPNGRQDVNWKKGTNVGRYTVTQTTCEVMSDLILEF